MRDNAIRNPEVIAALKEVATNNGDLLLPKDVVAAAKPVSSPLHSKFEWDDTRAGHLYRLDQARWLIRLVVVEVKTPAGQQVEIPLFRSLTPDRTNIDGGYRLTVNVLTDEAQRKQMLEDALAEMEHFERKYAKLTELADLFTVMKRLRRKIAPRLRGAAKKQRKAVHA